VTAPDAETNVKSDALNWGRTASGSSKANVGGLPRGRIAAIPIVITVATITLAVPFVYAMWGAYMDTPWTRDGTVRAYVATIAPEIAGRIVALPVADNQFVHKGDLLMTIDPANYKIAVRLAQATVHQTQVNAENLNQEAQRRQALSNLAVTPEEKQTFVDNAIAANAQYMQAQANLDQALVNLERARIQSPVNGFVTNLLARQGDYANVGQSRISIIDADSFWVDAYFEESYLASIHEGDSATIKLIGQSQILRGHVGSIARGINVPNAQPDQAGLASVNPIFTWVRLAQRIPVRIVIDEVPDSVHLVAGMTATVQIDYRSETKSR